MIYCSDIQSVGIVVRAAVVSCSVDIRYRRIVLCILKAAFQLRVFHAHVYARKSVNLSKINTNSNCLNKYKINHIEN